MNKKYLILLPALVVALTGGVLLTQKVQADEQVQSPTLIKRLIDRFNLNESEVDQFMTELRNERQEERRELVENKLQTAVDEGKITSDQKDTILQKMSAWQSEHKNWQNLTQEEKRAEAKNHREEMQKWAEENGIDLHSILGAFGRGYVKGFKRGYFMGNH